MVTSPAPELFALLGDPVEGNPTQEVIEGAFRQMGLDWRYISVRIGSGDLPAAIQGLRAMNFAGVHITVPHKVAVVDLVDSLTPTAAAAGAVNCLVRTDGGFSGDNTDGVGLTRAVGSISNIGGLSVALFGAGGAARAIAARLAIESAGQITVYNRDPSRRTALVQMIRSLGVSAEERPWPTQPIACQDDLVVNATSLGMDGNEWAASPIDWPATPTRCIAADAVIARETDFIADARRAGRTVVTGLDMLVEQAHKSLTLWTGRDASKATIRSIAAEQLDTALLH
jgi:shikimate dehydrogenase